MMQFQVSDVIYCQFPLCSVFIIKETLITRNQRELNEKCIQKMKSKQTSVYRTVALLPLGGATYRRFSLPVLFQNPKSANNWKMIGARRGVSTEHEQQAEVCLLIGQVTPAGGATNRQFYPSIRYGLRVFKCFAVFYS
jgi:hypothetical protein